MVRLRSISGLEPHGCHTFLKVSCLCEFLSLGWFGAPRAQVWIARGFRKVVDEFQQKVPNVKVPARLKVPA